MAGPWEEREGRVCEVASWGFFFGGSEIFSGSLGDSVQRGFFPSDAKNFGRILSGAETLASPGHVVGPTTDGMTNVVGPTTVCHSVATTLWYSKSH